MSIRRSLITAVSGRFAGVFLQIVGSLVIARLLAPAEFGLFGIAGSVIAISGSLREFGVSSYLIRLEKVDRTALGRALAFTLSISLAAGIVIFLSRHAIAAFFREPEIAGLISVLCLNFALIPPTIGATALLHRQMRFGVLNLMSLGCTVVSTITTLTLAAIGYGALSLAIGQVLQILLYLGCLTVWDWRSVVVRPVFTAMGDMIRFGSFSAMSSLVNQLGAYVTSLVLGRLLGPTAVGIYDRGNGLFVSLANDVVGTIGGVLFVGLSRVRGDRAELSRLLLQSLRNLTAIAWPGFLLVAVLAEPLMTVMFGPRWLPSAGVLRVLCLSGLLTSGTVLYFQTVLAMGATRRIFAIEATGQGVRVAAVLALAGAGVLGAAWAAVIAMGAIFLLYLVAVRTYVRARRREIIGIYAESLALAVATAALPALVVATDPFAMPLLIQLGASGILALVTWLIAIFTRHHPLAGELRRLIAQIRERLA